MVKNPPANAGDIRDAGLIPRSGRSPGGSHGHTLWYSCLENPTNRGACWATVHGVEESNMTKVTQHAGMHMLKSGASPVGQDFEELVQALW